MKCSTAVFSALFIAHAVAAASPLEDQIDAKLAPMFKAGAPGATVIVTRDGKPVFRKAYGLADVSAKTAMQPHMQLRVGSLTKQFTAVAILLLAEQGKLSLQDEVTRFLPDYPVKGQKITIEHLLQHKSGIRNYTALDGFWSMAEKDLSVAQMVDFFKNEPFDFTPGERYSYSNSGYFLLGAIIEKASGMPYADFIAKHIFEPLGMQDTAYDGHERNAKRHVQGYVPGLFSGYRAPMNYSMALPYAAGSVVSTVDDLARWDQAITEGKLLKGASWQQAFTPCTLPKNAACNYGYGWMMGKLRGHALISHGGDIPGFNGMALRLPDDKVFVAVLANSDRPKFNSDVAAQLAAAIALGDPFPEPKAETRPPEVLESFAGTYRLPDGSKRAIRRKGSVLNYEREGRPAVALKPYEHDAFFLDGTMNTVEFQRGADGTVKGLLLKQITGDTLAERVAN